MSHSTFHTNYILNHNPNHSLNVSRVEWGLTLTCLDTLCSMTVCTIVYYCTVHSCAVLPTVVSNTPDACNNLRIPSEVCIAFSPEDHMKHFNTFSLHKASQVAVLESDWCYNKLTQEIPGLME